MARKQGRTSAFRQHPQAFVRSLSDQLSRDRTGRCGHAPETFERKSDAERALVLIEAQLSAGEWTDPERGKVKLADYAATWIAQRPGLRPRSADNYRWLLKKHIAPRLGGVPVGKLSTPMIREWRAALARQGRVGLDGGEGVSAAACHSDDSGR